MTEQLATQSLHARIDSLEQQIQSEYRHAEILHTRLQNVHALLDQAQERIVELELQLSQATALVPCTNPPHTNSPSTS